MHENRIDDNYYFQHNRRNKKLQLRLRFQFKAIDSNKLLNNLLKITTIINNTNISL